jgi:hypothetical protein
MPRRQPLSRCDVLLTAGRKSWRCVETGKPPHLFGIAPPRPLFEVVRIVDMSISNSGLNSPAFFARPARPISNMTRRKPN